KALVAPRNRVPALPERVRGRLVASIAFPELDQKVFGLAVCATAIERRAHAIIALLQGRVPHTVTASERLGGLKPRIRGDDPAARPALAAGGAARRAPGAS